MGRLRQLFPQNYPTSANIHAEFEALIRYLNASELGNKTIAELLSQLYDEDGNFNGPIQMRLDSTNGLQYRIGLYDDEDDGWLTLSEIADIRGPSGQDVGTVEGPLFYNRVDYEATGNGITNIPYTFDENVDQIVVFKNGILLHEETTNLSASEYTPDPNNNQVVLTASINTGVVITIYSVRDQSVTNYRRSDYEAVGNISQVPFGHTADERLLVFKNGILQQEGGSNDYTADSVTDVITFMTPLVANDVATMITVENNALVNVGGLMLEDQYTNDSGLILFNKLAIVDGDIAQAKVNGLVSALAGKAKITVAVSAPGTPNTGDLWLDIAITPNQLKFYDGTTWLRTNPESTLPSFGVGDALKVFRVNGVGTGIEVAHLDMSGYVDIDDVGAANGVASLDSTGKIPLSEIPEIYSVDTLGYYDSGTSTNGTKYVKRIWKQKIRIDGITLKLASGTCDLQLSVDGTALTALGTFNVTSTEQNQTFGTVAEVDGTTDARRLELVISNASTPIGLEVGIAIASLNI